MELRSLVLLIHVLGMGFLRLLLFLCLFVLCPVVLFSRKRLILVVLTLRQFLICCQHRSLSEIAPPINEGASIH